MKVPAEKLRSNCELKELEFETSEKLTVRTGVIGQERAFEALRLGVGIKDKKFQIFVTGPSDIGKTKIIKDFLKKIIPESKSPSDWCYVYNFGNPDEPILISLEAGATEILKEDLTHLINFLQKEIPRLFESNEWQEKTKQETAELINRNKEMVSKLHDKAKEHGCVIVQAPNDILLVIMANQEDPLQPIHQTKFEKLTEEEQRKFLEEDKPIVEMELKKTLSESKRLFIEKGQLERKLQETEVEKLFDELSEPIRAEYANNPSVITHLDNLKKDIAKHLEFFLLNGADDANNDSGEESMTAAMAKQTFFSRYKVNVFVDNSQINGVPIIMETNPSYSNLFGSIKSEVHQGMLTTSFLNIKAGALQKAYGGYLIIPAYNLFKQPYLCWETLKRTIKDQEIKIDNAMTSYYFGGDLKTLKPQPMPFSGKIILIGDNWLYMALYEMDDQFRNIFKVKVELEEKIERNFKTIKDHLGVLAGFCQRNNILPFDAAAGAKLIDFLSELAENQKKLSQQWGKAEDLLKEADFWARQDKKQIITASEIEKALRKQEQRVNLIEEKYLELFKDSILKIDTSGLKIGQVNGLSVISYADHTFGIPSRITATAGYGEEKIVNADRKCDLAGKIQAKSVFEINGYLQEKYGKDFSDNLSVTLCFEQNYSGVEGDSASAAELFAVLSTIAKIPLRQDLAVTGSMNQHGGIQPIGGINFKIKGFFKVCSERGLTGTQGVIIPKDNLDELMLPSEIVKAVKIGKFHIYAISTIEEGLEYITGMKMEEIDKKIIKPKGLIKRLVKKLLK